MLKRLTKAAFYWSGIVESLQAVLFIAGRKSILFGSEWTGEISTSAGNNQIQQHLKKTEHTWYQSCTLWCNIIPAAQKEQKRRSNTHTPPLMPPFTRCEGIYLHLP